MKFKCKVCKKRIIDTPSSNRKFCSSRCKSLMQFKNKTKNPRWKGGNIKKKCHICEAVVDRKPSDLKNRKNVFCSGLCRNIFKNKNQSKKLTNIELAILEALAKKGIAFEIQKIFKRICVVDFYLPAYNLVIFCDGEYWHNYPNGKAKDKWDLEQLKKLGIKGVRLWGKQCLEEEPLKYLEKFITQGSIR